MHTYFSVCVTNGANESMVVTFVNKEIMKTHLLPISKATVSNSHVVVIMDGAGWHVDNIDARLDNVSIIKLPPYSPELNPIEQV
ncbi:transposase [Psychromonas arctica]|uniref:transposase n=1 Tax=Psychromonas arctica TaxID=168275 RepID=UPI002FD78DBE